jgi:hypothetical protein
MYTFDLCGSKVNSCSIFFLIIRGKKIFCHTYDVIQKYAREILNYTTYLNYYILSKQWHLQNICIHFMILHIYTKNLFTWLYLR